MFNVGAYIYSINEKSLYIHLYTESDVTIVMDSIPVQVVQSTHYPWEGKIQINIYPEREVKFQLGLRIPGWCRRVEVLLNGEPCYANVEKNGYLILDRTWKQDDRLTLELQGVCAIHGKALRRRRDRWVGNLYLPIEDDEKYEEILIKAIPYYAWSNRAEGEMTVWIGYKC